MTGNRLSYRGGDILNLRLWGRSREKSAMQVQELSGPISFKNRTLQRLVFLLQWVELMVIVMRFRRCRFTLKLDAEAL